MNKNNSNPIGIFDSGLGGLTVFKEIRKILPNEDLVYFGDTARVPYGNKSKETVLKYSKEISRFLIQKSVKIIVIACNTSSSLALNDLQKEIDIPVFGVIKPGAKRAVEVSQGGNIAVIGTQATIKSRAYSKTILDEIGKISESAKNDYMLKMDADMDIIEKSCPLFVPIVEEGLGFADDNPTGKDIAKNVIRYYLDSIIKENPSCLVLGCTHYPIIKDLIVEEIGRNIEIIDSGVETAIFIKHFLEEENMLKKGGTPGFNKFFVTDDSERFKKLGSKFLNLNIDNVDIVSDFV